MSTTPKVVIGCPVQNRAWILMKYLDGIVNLDYDLEDISLYFYANNCLDNTVDILNKFKNLWDDAFNDIVIKDETILKGRQDPQDRVSPRDYTVFAMARNRFLQGVRKLHQCEYLLSVDSDIILAPNSLQTLLDNDKDICSGLVWNGVHYGWIPQAPEVGIDIFNCQVGPNKDGQYFPFPIGEQLNQQAPFKVSVTGACVLIKKEVYDQINYRVHPQGEDASFCRQAIEKGYEVWCDPRVVVRHVLTKD